MECTNVLLAHIADVLVVLKQTDDDDMSSGGHGDENVVSDIESDGGDDEDDSGAEESVSLRVYLFQPTYLWSPTSGHPPTVTYQRTYLTTYFNPHYVNPPIHLFYYVFQLLLNVGITYLPIY